ncbi:MAG: hypothetical protein U0792_09060 [Gemmataceae bacterium]
MPTRKPRWWVYVLRCADDTLYTGVTTDVTRTAASTTPASHRSTRALANNSSRCYTMNRRRGMVLPAARSRDQETPRHDKLKLATKPKRVDSQIPC